MDWNYFFLYSGMKWMKKEEMIYVIVGWLLNIKIKCNKLKWFIM